MKVWVHLVQETEVTYSWSQREPVMFIPFGCLPGTKVGRNLHRTCPRPCVRLPGMGAANLLSLPPLLCSFGKGPIHAPTLLCARRHRYQLA